MKTILEDSWNVGLDFPVKGYDFSSFLGNETLIVLKEGNATRIQKAAQQVLPSSTPIRIEFIVYYGVEE